MADAGCREVLGRFPVRERTESVRFWTFPTISLTGQGQTTPPAHWHENCRKKNPGRCFSGLTAFTIGRRVKEIGIRKVLGASTTQVVLLLSREYLLIVLAANLIAWPVTYYTMGRWLQNFAYRIHLGILTFIQAGMLALLVALLTVSFQATRAARTNPAEYLRYE